MEQMESGTTTPLRDKESLPDPYAAARTYLRRADPVLGRLIDEHPDFDPRRWMTIRGAGLSHRKVETLRTLAERFIVDGLGEQTFLSSSDEEIEAKLTAIPGIGPWTVRGFLMIALDRPDVFPSGDLALRRAARRLYGLERLPTEQELLDIAERWKPYRSLAAGYLFLSEFDAKL